MKITTKGQVTIPQDIRRRYGLLPLTEVSFVETEDGVLLKPAKALETLLDERLERALGSATEPLTSDEILEITRGDN